MAGMLFQPQGFRSCAKNVGIKDETLDFTVILSDVPASATAMFTQSRFCGASITVDREQVVGGQLQAFVVISKKRRVAKSIVNSPLVKTAIFGADPNWGRVAMAIGKCDEQVDIVPEKVSIAFGDLLVYDGCSLGEDNLAQLKAYLQGPEVVIRVGLGLGNATATVWGCDLSYEYVRINGEYTT